MKTNEEPSAGAMKAASNIDDTVRMYFDYGPDGVEAKQNTARIIDSHTNAIADELAAALNPMIHGTTYITNEQVNTARQVIARYSAIKAKEQP